MIPRLILLSVLSAPAIAAGPDPAPAPPAPPAPRWYRGNTHTHTTLCDHADSTPEAVAKWYLDHGYQFLCLSEHNRFIDPAKVALPAGRREDFILIPGEEITGTRVHFTAFDTRRLVVPTAHSGRTKTVQAFADHTRAAGGIPIINHPNDRWTLSAADIRPVRGCRLFELYNAHPEVENDGDARHASTEKMWDTLLSGGMVMYGIASDDAHDFRSSGPGRSNPGRGWVTVRAESLTPSAIARAMERGDFYSSSGVILRDVRVNQSEYQVIVDPAATEAETARPGLSPHRLSNGGSASVGYKIDFVGPRGDILLSANGTDATFVRPPGLAYVRAKVTLTREAGGKALAYYAWTQPAFGDDRLIVAGADPAELP